MLCVSARVYHVLSVGWSLITVGVIVAAIGTRQRPALMTGSQFITTPLALWFKIGLGILLIGILIAAYGYRHTDKH